MNIWIPKLHDRTRHHFFLLLTLAVAIVPGGCFGNDSAKMIADTYKTEAPVFAPDTDLRIDPDNGTIRYLKFKDLTFPSAENSRSAQNPEETALSFINRYRTWFKLDHPKAELRCISVISDSLGQVHVRFQQVFAGIDIWAKEINVHLDKKGQVHLVQGLYIPTPEHMDTSPVIRSKTAVGNAMALPGLPRPSRVLKKPELVIYVKATGNATLAYQVYLPGWLLFVDAKTGDIIERITTRQTGGRGFTPLETK